MAIAKLSSCPSTTYPFKEGLGSTIAFKAQIIATAPSANGKMR
jgi:hypothetical protein